MAEVTEAAECFNMLSALVEIGASAQEDVLLIDPSWLPHLLGMELIETNADGTCKRIPLEECSEEVLLKLFGTGHDGVEPTEVGASAKGNEISGVPAYLTVADCLARLPVKLSERTFRKLVRRCGTFIEHRKQMPLTEDDFAAVLETMRPCSSSSSVPRVRTGKCEVRFCGVRVRESTGTGSKAHAETILSQRQQEILDRLTFGEKHTATFGDAANLYLDLNRDDRYLEPLIRRWGMQRIAVITQLEIARAGREIYPDCKAATLMRQLYTPLIAVLNCAAHAGLCPKPAIKRPKVEHAKVSPSDDATIDTVMAAKGKIQFKLGSRESVEQMLARD